MAERGAPLLPSTATAPPSNCLCTPFCYSRDDPLSGNGGLVLFVCFGSPFRQGTVTLFLPKSCGRKLLDYGDGSRDVPTLPGNGEAFDLIPREDGAVRFW